jgi:hypothetical protein
VELDRARSRDGQLLPPFVRWDQFVSEYFDWDAGEHVITIGPTGSGKTVLNFELLKYSPIPWVVVFGVKRRDPELYGPFQRRGYQLVHTFNAKPEKQTKFLYVPTTRKQGREARQELAEHFRRAMYDILDHGAWVVYIDDVIVLSRQYNLRIELEDLWQLGRSEEISVVASAQEPVNIPVVAYGSSTWLFVFRNPDMRRVGRIGELTGFNRELAFETILRLPKYEVLAVNKDSGEMVRTKVIR